MRRSGKAESEPVAAGPSASAESLPGLQEGGAASSQSDLAALLQRMRSGDRVAAALFVTCYGSLIRRRIRGKLRPEMRSVWDSQDILATLGRRLDRLVRLGRIEAASEEELWALAFRTAEQAVQEKSRAFRRSRKRELLVSRIASKASSSRCQSQLSGNVDGFDLDHAMRCLRDDTDRLILSLWVAGTRWSVIAAAVGLTQPATRKRGERIKLQLKERLGPEVGG